MTTIKSLCDLITHLVTDILDVERAVNGQISINTSEVNLCSLFNDIDKTLIQTKSEKPHIKFKMENNVKLNVVIDKYRVQQILLNLLSNALNSDWSINAQGIKQSKNKYGLVKRTVEMNKKNTMNI